MKTPVDYSANKAELRRQILKTRKSMSVSEWKQRSDRLCRQLANLTLFTQATTVLAYFSFLQEPDLSTLFLNIKHNWGFPRCVGKSLNWHLWNPGDPTQVNAYGILEPVTHAPLIASTQVDLILVPCVACDRQGYRLGYGGGYYDRLLSLPEWETKPTIGIVFDFALLPQLPIASWDKPLHSVISDSLDTN